MLGPTSNQNFAFKVCNADWIMPRFGEQIFLRTFTQCLYDKFPCLKPENDFPYFLVVMYMCLNVKHLKRCINTFCFNIKSSLLKLLCTLARLCEGTPIQPLRLDFLSHPRSTLRFAIIAGMTTEQGESHSAHQLAPIPNQPTTATLRPYPRTNYNPLR